METGVQEDILPVRVKPLKDNALKKCRTKISDHGQRSLESHSAATCVL